VFDATDAFAMKPILPRVPIMKAATMGPPFRAMKRCNMQFSFRMRCEQQKRGSATTTNVATHTVRDHDFRQRGLAGRL